MAMRRRTHKRKTTQDTINMAEARREIAYALKLHRSSSPSSSVDSTKRVGTNSDNYTNVKTNFFLSHDNYCDYYCHPLLETLPCPEPMWSTTAPSVLAAATESPGFEATELVEWGENDDEAASYSWWLGFLNTLDCKSSVKCVDSFGIGGEYKQVGSAGLGESPNKVVNVESSDQISLADEWLLFLTTEDQAKDENLPFKFSL